MKSFGLVATCAALALGASGAQAAEKPLRIVMVDVEGGAATLFVTPQGHSLLVDAGWPPGEGGPEGGPKPTQTSADRIVAAARSLGVKRIDYMLISHYHVDHVGGLFALAQKMPIGTFIDHGPVREAPAGRPDFQPAYFYPRYVALTKGHPRMQVKPGQHLSIDGLRLDFVTSDGATIARPLRGAGQATQGCRSMQPISENGGEENPRSVGFVASYGKAKILDLSDLTWNVEKDLVCPVSKIPPVDVLLVSHHGYHLSSSPALVAAAAPRVALVCNGPVKGGDKVVLETLANAPSKPAVWQLHSATKSPEADRPADYLANLAGPDTGFAFDISVAPDGDVTVVNSRNGFRRSYKAPAG